MVKHEQVKQEDPWATRVAGLHSHGPCPDMPHFKAAALPNPRESFYTHPLIQHCGCVLQVWVFLHLTNSSYINKSIKIFQYPTDTCSSITASCSSALLLLLLFPIRWCCDSTQAVVRLPTCNRLKSKSTKTKRLLQTSRRPHRSQNHYSLLIRRETGKVCKKVCALGCLLQYIQSGQTQNECMLLKEEEDMLVQCC